MKYPIPQIVSRTGVSAGYLNEYSFIYPLLDPLFNAERSARILGVAQRRPFRRYEERFNPEMYEGDFSNPRIDLLNQIADYVNAKTRRGELDIDEIIGLTFVVGEIINGKPNNHFPKFGSC